MSTPSGAEPVTLVLGDRGLAGAYAWILAGLGHHVVYVPTGQAHLPRLPRVPDPILARLTPEMRATQIEQFVPVSTLHAVTGGHPYWEAAVRYADTEGVTLRLRASRTVPQPDTAPKWQPMCATGSLELQTAPRLHASAVEQLPHSLERRWGRWYWQAPTGPASRVAVRRFVALLGSAVEPIEAPYLHGFQTCLDGFGWTLDGPDCWSGGSRSQLESVGMTGASATAIPAELRGLPVQVWRQHAVLARGSAWWYDACGSMVG